MHSSRRIFAGLLSVTVLLSGAMPIAAKDAQWESHFNAGTKAELEGNYAEAQNELAEALKLTAKFQMNDPRLGKTYYEVGELRLKQEDWPGAQQYFERALKVQDKLGDPESIDVGNTVAGLATAHEQLGNHQMAVLLLKRVRKIWIKQYGANDERLTSILPAMATYAMLDSDYATAQDCYRQLVAIEEHLGGANSAQLGSALNSLASCLAYIGKFAEAEPIARRAVDVLTANGETPTALDAANANLQYICQKLGKPAPVISMKPQAVVPVVQPVQPVAPSIASTQVTGQLIAGKPPEPEASTPKPEAKPAETKPVEATRVESKLESKPIATKPTESKPAETKVAESKSESKPAPSKPAEPKPVIAKQPESKPVETKPASPSTNKPVVAVSTPSIPNVPSRPAEGSGKVQYLAGGKLISPEQFKAMTIANNAYELIREEKYTMAIQLLKNALAIYPDLASAHANLGLAYSQLGQINDAEAQLRQAITIDATRPSAWLNLASTLQISGQLKQAADTFGEFIQRFPNQKLVAKVQRIKSQIDAELQEQAQVEQAGSPSSVDYYTYASHGSAARWPSDKSTIKVCISSGSGIAGFKQEYAGFLSDSFQQWETACPKVKFQIVKNPTDSDIECLWTDDATKIASPLEGGQTDVRRGGVNISHATITILTKGPAADTQLSPNQIRVVCLHQIGHALGLAGHSPKPQDVMFCSLPPASVKVPLSSRDTATIQKLYTGTPLVSYIW